MAVDYCHSCDKYIDLDYTDGYETGAGGCFVCQDCEPWLYYLGCYYKHGVLYGPKGNRIYNPEEYEGE